ncbi:MAG: hypothetical protein CSA65_02885 [Proteobacteria bacterium]|nr:MAG: hypothetical protein CSA65_02885 [Pseudomonadota bacterium]
MSTKTARTTALSITLASTLSLVVGCTGENPFYCQTNSDCKTEGYFCDVSSNTCRPSEAGLSDTTPIDAPKDPLENGKPCGTNDHCQSGHCVDGVCCAGACDGVCLSCVVAGKEGECVAVAEGDDPRGDCAGQDAECGGKCNGSGACSYADTSTPCGDTSCENGVLNSGRCDGMGLCVQSDVSCGGYRCKSSNTCKDSCTSASDCVSPASCDTSDNTCKSQQKNGTPCGTNGDLCASGYCVDGVCCAATSCPECQSCNISGKEGSCEAVSDGLSCGAGETCSSNKAEVETCVSGACKKTTSDCAPFACDGQNKACATSCSDDTGCAPTAYCDKSQATCVPKKPSGQSCGAANECKSGLKCTAKEKVCCPSVCGGECETCVGKSACTPLPKGTKCGGPDTCVDGTNTSTLTENRCNGTLGTCESNPTLCDPYKCDVSGAAACATRCSAHTDCNSLICQIWDSGATANTCVNSTSICYVDANATSSGSGTLASPHKTISACLAKPHLYVAVAPGIYTEDLTFTHETTLVSWKTPNTFGNPLLDLFIPVGLRPTKTITLPPKAKGKVRIAGVRIEGQKGSITFFEVHDQELYLERGALLDTSGACINATYSTITLREMSIGRCYTGIRHEVGTLDMKLVTVHGTSSVGIWFESGTLTARDLNTDFAGGAGLLTYVATVDIDRARAFANKSTGFALSSSTTGNLFNFVAARNGGAGLDLTGSQVGVHMSTIVDNNGSAAVICDSTKTSDITNSIVWAGDPTMLNNNTTYSGNCSLSYCAVNKQNTGSNLLVQVPMFIAPSTQHPDFMPKSGSPCVDAGNDALPTGISPKPTKDYGGNARYQDVNPGGQKIDIGAFERPTP